MVKAMCVLHNLLIQRESTRYTPPGSVDTADTPGLWRQNENQLPDLPPSTAHNSAGEAVKMREAFVDYMMSPEGSLAYQLDYVNRCQ